MIPAMYTAYRAARDAGDVDLARRYMSSLIIQSEHLISRPARRLKRDESEYEDLMQAGRMALAKAIDSYRPELGAFAALARVKISEAFQFEVISRRAHVPAGPRWGCSATNHSLCKMPKAVLRAEQAFFARTGREATAEDLGVDADDLATWRARTKTESYEDTVFRPEAGPQGDDVDSEAVIAAAVQDVGHVFSRKVRQAIGGMTPQEQRVLYGKVIEDLDWVTIGQNEGLLRDSARRVYLGAIEKLRAVMR